VLGSERLGDRPIGFVHSRPSAPGVFENTVNSRRDSAIAINPKKSLCHHSKAGHSRQHKSMIANGIASTTSTTRMRATRAHESFRSHDGVGAGGPFAPASSIASISSGMRSAKKKPKKRGGRLRPGNGGVGDRDARRWTTSKYSCKRVRLEVVVTTTKPFAWAHLKMTCPGVPPILRAMVANTVSRGPLGYVVIGLSIVFERQVQ